MKTLYIDCGMGAAGDMLAAAVYELLPPDNDFAETMRAAGIPGVEFNLHPAEKCGITGTYFHVTVNGETEGEEMHAHAHHHHDDDDHDQEHHYHDDDHDHEHHHHDDDHNHDHPHHHRDDDHDHHHHHSHHSLADVTAVIDGLHLPEQVRTDAKAVYGLIAAAEGHAHGMPVTDIHFHEVGTMDAIADITAVCLLLHMLAPEKIIASPVCTGYGHVHCAHGILPVPAPATAYLLQGVPMYSGEIESELCTPTGAALVKYFVHDFGGMPVMTTEKTGYGMGHKNFARANCVRAFLGETTDDRDTVYELSCNLDDMTGEDLAFAAERIMAAGARDVFTVPVGMKKGRSGVLLVTLADEKTRDDIVRTIFRHTTTLGIREKICGRYLLRRQAGSVETPFGTVRVKTAQGYGTQRAKAEADDLQRLAREQNSTVREIRRAAEESINR